jgi:hypothetical protein
VLVKQYSEYEVMLRLMYDGPPDADRKHGRPEWHHALFYAGFPTEKGDPMWHAQEQRVVIW